MDRIFLDANVLFSAAYREGAGLLALWELPGTVVLTSGYALAEACRNLRPGEQQDRLQSLLVSATVIEAAQEDSAGFDEHSLPEKDRPILRAAVRAGASHLLTGDLTHFGRFFGHRLEGVLVLPPGEYLRSRREG